MGHYHEKQGCDLQCGLHAVNNACGHFVFDDARMREVGDEIAKQICGNNTHMLGEVTSTLYDEDGYYSVEVLLVALRTQFKTVAQIRNASLDVFGEKRPDALLLWRRASGTGHYYVAIRDVDKKWVVIDSLKTRVLYQSDHQILRRLYRPRVFSVRVEKNTCSSLSCGQVHIPHVHHGISRDQLVCSRKKTQCTKWNPPNASACLVTIVDEADDPGPYRAWALSN